MEIGTDFLFLGSKITVDGNYSYEIRRQLLLGRKDITNLASMLKSWDITLQTKVHIVTAMVFLPSGHIRLWELNHKEGRTPKNWCLRTVVLKKTSESLLDSKEINQSILREINHEYSLEGLMLKLQYFGHLIWTANSLEKSLMLGKTEGRRKRGRQRMTWLDGITDGQELGQTPGDGEGQEARHAAVHGVSKSQTRLGD